MEIIGVFILFLYALALLFVLVALIYLIVRRVDERDNETFEKRKN